MSIAQNPRLGIAFMSATMFTFAVQDGISLHLTSQYNVMMVVMIRYWFFAAFVMTVSAKMAGGLRNAARTEQPILQASRGILLAAEICVMMVAFNYLGLVESLAIFTANPLIVAALSFLVLGEIVGWRRWMAIGVGFIGVLIILKPGFGVFSPHALIALISAAMFAVYVLLTRFAARKDSAATSFFWTGTMGAIVMTGAGIWFWEPMSASNAIWMATLCCTGALGHWMLIKCYELAEAPVLQPFAYLQFVFGATIGVLVFREAVELNVIIGAALIVAAGLFTLWRERRQQAARRV